ncbi:MAG: amidohydrolase family protein [Frankiaceae bacterium]|nr:amidohydrolase family protein [Frankiaceae bacterium]
MSVVLRGVTVVDPRNGTLAEGKDVLIEGDRISAVAPAGSLAAGEVVNGAGGFVVPGFVDMHAHAMENKDPSGTLALMLAHGITGFRQMSGSDRILRMGPLPADAPAMLARPGDLLTPFTAGSADKAVATVRHQHELGADFVKSVMTPASVFAAAQAEANRLGIPLLGHLPLKADVARVCGDGMRSIEHLGAGVGLLACCSSEQATVEAGLAQQRDISIPPVLQPLVAPLFKRVLKRIVVNPLLMVRQPEVDIYEQAAQSFDEDAAATVASMLKASGTWQVPTLIRAKTMQLCSDPAFGKDPDLRYMAPAALKAWNKAAAKFGSLPDATRQTFALTNAVMMRLVKVLDDHGVPMLTGSDACGAAWVVPGASLHAEFDELARAGISPLRVLQMTTSDAADFLGRSDLGSVEAGRQADLVVLGANPLESVASLHAVTGVVRAGRWYDVDALTGLRERVAAARSAA